MDPIRLTETGSHACELTEDQAERLERSGLVKVSRGVGAKGRWSLAARGKVGVARVDEMELWIEPKLHIRRLLFLLGYARNPEGWRDDPGLLGDDLGIVPALGQLLWRQVEAALNGGLYQGYRTADETSYVMRGRLRMSSQVRRHHGRSVPMELRYDDFTPNMAENRILLSAIDRILEEPRLDDVSRTRLEGQRSQLAAVASPVRGLELPTWQPNRRNQHYRPALTLAELIWRARSPEYPRGSIEVTGFMFNLANVFERFLETALGEYLCRRYGGFIEPQRDRHLDVDSGVVITPDLVWRKENRVAAIVDAKYKVEKRADRNPQLYQLLAYCTALGASGGYLVYAQGDAEPGRYVVRNAGTRLVCYALDLDQQPADLLAQVERLADELATVAQD